MTRKDFVLIADVISRLDPVTHGYKFLIANAFADELRGTNPNFDRQHFIEACKGK